MNFENERHEVIRSYVNEALLKGESFLPLNEDDNIKSIQRYVRRYAGKGKVVTYQNAFDELVILRKGNPSDAVEDDIDHNAKEVDSRPYKIKGSPTTLHHNIRYVMQEVGPIARFDETPNFKVGDSGKLVCGEPYVVLEKKKDGQLLVNVKSQGHWKIGLRNSDGTCVYDYTNKHRFALLPPEKQLPAIQKRTIYVNVYKNYAYSHPTEQQAIEGGDRNTAMAIAVPVTFEFTPLR